MWGPKAANLWWLRHSTDGHAAPRRRLSSECQSRFEAVTFSRMPAGKNPLGGPVRTLRGYLRSRHLTNRLSAESIHPFFRLPP